MGRADAHRVHLERAGGRGRRVVHGRRGGVRKRLDGQPCLEPQRRISDGDERQPGDFPENSLEGMRDVQMDWSNRRMGLPNALFDFRINPDISVLVGCGLGGTSLINANVAIPPDERVWRELQDRYVDYFAGGMGAEAVKDLVSRLELNEVEEELKEIDMYDSLNAAAIDYVAHDDGGLYIFPEARYGNSIFYWTDNFKKYGLEKPETFDDLLEISAVLKENREVWMLSGLFWMEPWFSFTHIDTEKDDSR